MKIVHCENARITLRNKWTEMTDGEAIHLLLILETVGTSIEYKKGVVLVLMSTELEKVQKASENKYRLGRMMKRKLNSETDALFWIFDELKKSEWPTDREHVLNILVNPFLSLDSLDDADKLRILLLTKEDKEEILAAK